MDNDIDQVVMMIAAYLSEYGTQSYDVLVPQIRAAVTDARARYRAANVPYGDHGPGFLRWLFDHPIAWR